MKYFAVLFLLVLFISPSIKSQNLVRNGSFEVKLSCPDDYVSFYREQYVRYWDSPNTGTPDYFNACSNKCGVPLNWVGKAESKEGNAYMGIIGCLLQSDPNQISYREYLRTQLKQPLDSGKQYYAEMHIRLALSCNTACAGMGMFFSTSNLQSQRNYNYPIQADITYKQNTIVANKNEWTKICGTFTANGGEEYLIIGNFLSNQEMKHQSFDENFIKTLSISPMAYYYVDAVYVGEYNAERAGDCEAVEDTRTLAEFTGELTPNLPMVLKELYFETDKAVIKTQSHYQLNQLVLALKRNPRVKITVNGHTDNVGTAEYNQSLSEQRAEAVKLYLMTKGISKFRISSKGYGKTKPVADNNTEEGKQLNRRVEIEVVD